VTRIAAPIISSLKPEGVIEIESEANSGFASSSEYSTLIVRLVVDWSGSFYIKLIDNALASAFWRRIYSTTNLLKGESQGQEGRSN